MTAMHECYGSRRFADMTLAKAAVREATDAALTPWLQATRQAGHL
jgi:hypothetical protein